MALTKVTSGVRTLGTGEVATANMAVDPTNASNLSSGSVPLAQLGNAPATDTSVIEDDIALLGFKVAANGSFGKYNLVDQTEDAFMDATGIDASESTNEVRSSSNYYTGAVSAPTGGTVVTYTDTGTDYRAHTFLDDGTFTIIAGTISADYFMVAGGGGGGNAGDGTGAWGAGGGAGAGGFLTDTSVSLISQVYTITVGDGGAGSAYQASTLSGVSGGNSSIVPVSGTSYIAIGGGGGASSVTSSVGIAGGSGGGGSYGSRASGAGTVGPPRQGYDGGTNTYTNSGAGGGGAGSVGGAAGAGASNGGTGVSNNYRDGTSGTTVGTHYFGGGGGGGGYNAVAGAATYGGGDAGLWNGTVDGTSNGSDATAASGGGGGAGSNSGGGAAQGGGGGDGGKGIVVIRYEDTGFSDNDMTLVSNSTTANDGAPTNGDIVMTYTNGVGTSSVNTDLKAYCSRDNGTTYTLMTLVAQGTTGSASPHFIVSAHNVDISSQPSGTAMLYKIETLNQSPSKETRIQAVSLGWS